MPTTETPERANQLRHFLSRASLRATLLYLLAFIALVAAVLALGREIEHHIAAIESWLVSLGPWAPVSFMVLFALATSLLLPETLLCVVGGALFGLPWGTAAAAAGSLLGGTLQFALSRRLLQARIQRTVAAHPSLAAIQRAVRHDELRLQVLLRLTPLNPATISYLLGAAGVRFPGFLIAYLALMPALAIEVYFGHVGKHVALLAGAGSRTRVLQDFLLLGGAAVCVFVMASVSRLARNAVIEAVAASGAAQPRGDS